MPAHHDLHVPEYVPIKPWRLRVRISFLGVMAVVTGVVLFGVILGAVRATEFTDAVLLSYFLAFFPLSILHLYGTTMLLKHRTNRYYQRSKILNRIYIILFIILVYWTTMYFLSTAGERIGILL